PGFWRMVLELGVAAVLAAAVSGAVVMTIAWVALPLRPFELVGVVRLQLVLATAMVASTAGASLLALRDLRPLHRSVALRAEQGPRAELAPPPEAAIRDAFTGPVRVGFFTFFVLVTILLVDGFGPGGVSGIHGPRRFAVLLLSFGVFQGGVLTEALVWRALLWRWLSRLPPEDVYLHIYRALTFRYALRVGSALALVSCAVLSVPVAYLTAAQELSGDPHDVASRTFLGGATLAAVLGLGLGILFGVRLGRRVAEDVSLLDRFVRAFTARSGWSSGEHALRPPAERLRTRAAVELAERIEALSEKYQRMTRAEERARRAIEDTQRLKARFMAYMSHDLRSPLNSITGFADLLAQEVDGPLNDEQAQSVQAIRESGEVLLRLVTDIVDTARLEAGKLKLDLREVDVLEVLAEAMEMAKDLAPRKDVRFELIPGVGAPERIPLDRDRAVQAFAGVLGHVIRMVRGGVIHIETSAASDQEGRRLLRVLVDASDLPAEDTQRIFVAFREIRRPSGRRVGGLGLGLALARSLVVAHGGELQYGSAGPHGARFTFSLPPETQAGPT
ncbi:MAG TPA: HAMP domain-containing sensor histidine kinase, partial [Polyangiaceae bacterium LLY-WYZ-15_(1-7)]|nr:HAMP domain-containing sensor histidine kinase [Polyangiaceae bacterium LLY-WYZ-15_(1-7)]